MYLWQVLVKSYWKELLEAMGRSVASSSGSIGLCPVARSSPASLGQVVAKCTGPTGLPEGDALLDAWWHAVWDTSSKVTTVLRRLHCRPARLQ